MLKTTLLSSLLLSAALSGEVKVLAFSGSTRDDSCNKKLLNEAVEIAKSMGASVTVIDLKEYPIPFYDADLEAKQGMPPQAKKIRDLLIQSNAVMIASPEYNGSVSAVLKNLIDWLSRNEKGQPSREAFAGKKVALLSASPGTGGGARGLSHLTVILQNVGAQPIEKQIVVPNAYNAFDSQCKLLSEEKRGEIRAQLQDLIKSAKS